MVVLVMQVMNGNYNIIIFIIIIYINIINTIIIRDDVSNECNEW